MTVLNKDFATLITIINIENYSVSSGPCQHLSLFICPEGDVLFPFLWVVHFGEHDDYVVSVVCAWSVWSENSERFHSYILHSLRIVFKHKKYSVNMV